MMMLIQVSQGVFHVKEDVCMPESLGIEQAGFVEDKCQHREYAH